MSRDVVLGIDSAHQVMALQAWGTDVVVPDLVDVHICDDTTVEGSSMISHATALPSGPAHLDTIRQRAAHKQLVIFLDYDGTLTPSVLHPENTHDQLADTEAVGAFLDSLATMNRRDSQG